MSSKHAFVFTLVASFVPAATAFAQSLPYVRVSKDKTEITTSQDGRGDVLMTAVKGTVLEVIHIEGDRYQERKDNWYWVVLPRDAWGTRRAGWIDGKHVQHLPPAEALALGPDAAAEGTVASEATKAENAAEASAAVEATAGETPAMPEVVLHFEFGKSALTADAKAALDQAAAALKANAQTLSVSLEGHADSVGTEPFNEKLGLARAESVKRYLAEQHQIPAEKISVASQGESHPAASNDTREGRAQNRRVVIKVG